MISPTANLVHPATLQLLRYRSSAKLARIAASFRNPRRQLLSVVAVALGFIWLSQAIAAVMLRQSAARTDLIKWIPIGLLAYTLWHLIKIVSRKPVEPFEWTTAEDEYVRAAPITRPQLISYRLTSIIISSTLKALCFSIVMIPDLSIWLAGFVGMLLGLTFVELLRVSFELIFHGLSKRAQLVSRVTLLGTVGGLVAWTLAKCMFASNAAADIASPGALLFFKSFIGEVIELASTPVGDILLLPFAVFSQLILIDASSIASLGLVPVAVGLVGSAMALVYRLDRWMLNRVMSKEKASYQKAANQNPTLHSNLSSNQTIRIPFRLGGFGSIAWRQLLGAYHYRMTLCISLGLPTLLCCIPMLAKHNPTLMLINVIGGVVFYSFLLLPSALMLDFRRDINRMSVLKSLPISPLAMTLGQLAAPVLICSMFQWGVLLIATLTGSVIPWQATLAGVLLIPVSLLIFAIENFIFMVSPYRHNQEGIDVFLRTILTFTAKGILFAIALAGTVAWALASRFLAGHFLESVPAAGPLIFGIGIWLITCLLASGFILGIVRLYRRFDPSQDVPVAG